jgi:hypothetical protein
MQVEAFAMGRSLANGNPTACGVVLLSVIKCNITLYNLLWEGTRNRGEKRPWLVKRLS